MDWENQERDDRGGAACALPASGLSDRLGEWRTVAGHALSREAWPGRIASTYPRDLVGRLNELIAAEAECCPFLSFDVREREDHVEVELRFPPEFEPMVSAIVGKPEEAARPVAPRMPLA